MNLAEAITKVFNEINDAKQESMIAEGYHKVLSSIVENMTMNRITTTVWLDDVFDTKKYDFSIDEYVSSWKEISSKLEANGFEIVSFNINDDDFDATIQPK